MFIAIDGDDVGRKIELYIIDNRIEDLENFTHSLTKRLEWLANQLRYSLNVKIHLLGGDSILVSCKNQDRVPEILEELRIEFSCEGLPTISIGIGKTPREAYLALKYAKLREKNCVVVFEDINDAKNRVNSYFV